MENSKRARRRIPPRWTDKFFEVKKIADEPGLNTQGFWKKPEFSEIKIASSKDRRTRDSK
jgi:hypothetical protein